MFQIVQYGDTVIRFNTESGKAEVLIETEDDNEVTTYVWIKTMEEGGDGLTKQHR